MEINSISMFFFSWKTSSSVWNKTIHPLPFQRHKRKSEEIHLHLYIKVHIAFCLSISHPHFLYIYLYIFLVCRISLWSFETEVQALRIETEEKSLIPSTHLFIHFCAFCLHPSSGFPPFIQRDSATECEIEEDYITVWSEERKQQNSVDTPLIPP